MENSSIVKSPNPTIEEQRNEIEKLKNLTGIEEVHVDGAKVNKRKRTFDEQSEITKDYIEYDFSKIEDTKGGYLLEEKKVEDLREKPAERELREQEERQKKLRLAPLNLDPETAPKCFECDSIELDTKYFDIFHCRVCHTCREKYPDKYSLLTKTECKLDYLLTEPELQDQELLPRLLKANPHQQGWSNMMLYLRYQVEEFAKKKWGSMEALDAEFERREVQKKEMKEKKFEKQLLELRKRTRTSNYSRMSIREKRKHVHSYDEEFEKPNEPGVIVQRCKCGLEIEQLEI
ncbi:DNA repair protein rad14 [Schizosaccharomyces pombe]|uniref:DNA repair protein rad14 n=1 Tax=Schizosaccharomyces pombe (strain 972 / ATCC 24843) TaxID=284812 RepID=RAD14_SCHPO|nr:DNA repair protein [Schizosaccharomyces pombe]O59753.1 RecName: Full=DNA repair protein rad14; AltName: Full=XP-A family homolog rhp14 [Schizosaccharomyces pombe 972h-]CAA19045.1 XP-A family homolog Rhp14 [Schizosaccharomyces pombe]|eukprot:NP_595222.1 DNA repair protein [Schizosaccharomyces pombe]